jgi:DNA-binding NtrC family response regulator
MASILLIDDDVGFSGVLQHALSARGHRVDYLERATEGLKVLASGQFDLVLLDNRMPGMSGIEFLQALQESKSSALVILMTSHGTTETAIRAMNLGAFDYLIKPLRVDELAAELDPLISKAVEMGLVAAQPVHLPGDSEASDAEVSGMLLRGHSKPMQEVYKLIGKVAGSDSPVLIRGETGVGKELVARAIHAHSPRKSRPLVAINCTALNEHLLDSELFGHEPGAFTGAAKLRKGRFEYADGGTLFLDEVGDMPPSLQAKLLRVLETHEVSRMGSSESINVDVRVVSATHRDLELAIAEGRFREDLFYRLNGVTIQVPPLRDRGEDLVLLAEHFVVKAAKEAGRPPPAVEAGAWEVFRHYPWPGNVRQLQNAIRRAVLVCHSQITASDIVVAATRSGQPTQPQDQSKFDEKQALAGLRIAVRWALQNGHTNVYSLLQEMLEREMIRLAMVELGGNQTQVAKRLGMARNTVHSRVQTYGLDQDHSSEQQNP